MYSIGDVSKRSGVNIETIRYYERQGIVPAPGRSPSGRRLYDRDGLAKLRFIKRSRELGFSIADARALLALATIGGMSCGEARPIARVHLANVEEKLAELMRLRDALTELVSKCADDGEACPLLQVLLDEEPT